MRNLLVLGGSLCIATAFAQTSALRLEAALQALPQSPAWRLADLEYQGSQRVLQSAQAVGGLRFNLEAGLAQSQLTLLELQSALGMNLTGGIR